jgi:hypothetical protein
MVQVPTSSPAVLPGEHGRLLLTLCVAAASQALPAFLFVTVFVNIFFILTKGAKNIVSIEFDKGAWISCLVGLGVAAIASVIGFPIIKKKLAELQEQARWGESCCIMPDTTC